MWHEARKQEKALKGMMVNFQRRAERRREYYERTKLNPLKMLRIHGRSMKIHVDAAMAAAGDAPSTMMPWSGDSNVMISRFDVRAHLDYIPPFKKESSPDLSYEEEQEELWCNYERYRTLVQSAFKGISEEKCLKEIEIEDMYPETKKKINKEKAKLVGSKAAIGFDYDGGTRAMASGSFPRGESPLDSDDDDDEDDKLFSSESDYEVDMDVDMMSRTDVDKLNLLALEYGVTGGYFSRSLRSEKVDLRDQKEHRLAEREKSALHGKKSRKERKMLKESIVAARRHSPRSYSMRSSPTYEEFRPEGERGDSSSRSSSPEKEARIEYITSFGGEDKQKQGDNHPSSSSRGGGGATGSVATKKGGASGSSRSGGMGGGRRDSGRGDGIRRRSGSTSRSRYSEREWRSDNRRHRSLSRESRRRRRHSHSRSRSHSRTRSRFRSRDQKKRYSRSRSRSSSPRRRRRSSRSSRSPPPVSRHRSRSGSQDRRSRLQYSRRSRSRSKTPSKATSESKSRSRSPPPKLKRYRRSTPSSSDDQHTSPEQERSKESTQKPITLPVLKSKEKGKMTPQEKLQKRLQAQISKQVKLDKKKQRSKEHSLSLQHAAQSSGGYY